MSELTRLIRRKMKISQYLDRLDTELSSNLENVFALRLLGPAHPLTNGGLRDLNSCRKGFLRETFGL